MRENVLFRLFFISFQGRVQDGLEIGRRGNRGSCLSHGDNRSEERRLEDVRAGTGLTGYAGSVTRLRPLPLPPSLAIVDSLRPRLLQCTGIDTDSNFLFPASRSP